MIGAHGQRWLGPAALAVFLGLPCLLATLTIFNLVRWSQATEGYADRSLQLARLEAKVRGLAAVAPSVPDPGPTPFLAALSASLARAELQTRLTGLVEKAGGRLAEVQTEDDAAGADPRSLLARATLEIRNLGLVDLLTALEAGRPVLTIEGLNVRPMQGRTALAEDNPILRVVLAVRGYRRDAQP